MKRRGYTLLELLIVIGLLSALAVATTMLVASIMLHMSRQRDNYQTAQVASRFAADWRRDVRAAKQVAIADPANTLKLTLDDGRAIEYAADSTGVTRVMTQPDGKTPRELYRLPDVSNLRFARDDVAPGKSLLTCTWRQPWHGPQSRERDGAPLRDHRIDAALVSEEASDE
jgi:prepilin-type N-terminal cleavage/methylation domain-containing protein